MTPSNRFGARALSIYTYIAACARLRRLSSLLREAQVRAMPPRSSSRASHELPLPSLSRARPRIKGASIFPRLAREKNDRPAGKIKRLHDRQGLKPRCGFAGVSFRLSQVATLFSASRRAAKTASSPCLSVRIVYLLGLPSTNGLYLKISRYYV